MKDKERIEINQKYKGYEYLVYASPWGQRCGYVKIPRGHYLYGKSYSDPLRVKFEQISKEHLGKRSPITLLCAALTSEQDNIRMDLLFDVHGSITFSGKGKGLKMNKPGWWIGFDCGHCDDAKDISIMDKHNIKIEERFHHDYGIIRTKEYVEQECKNLIDQIIKWFDSREK